MSPSSFKRDNDKTTAVYSFDASFYATDSPQPRRARLCGACGPRGKCTLANGHKGKHEGMKGFRW